MDRAACTQHLQGEAIFVSKRNRCRGVGQLRTQELKN